MSEEQTSELGYIEDNKQPKEYKMKMEIKQTAKKELYYAYVVRADTVEELAKLSAEVKVLAKKECNQQDFVTY